MLYKSLEDSWRFFRNHIVAIALIVLPVAIPVDILLGLYQRFYAGDEFVLAEQMPPLLVAAAAYAYYMVAVVYYIASVLADEPIEQDQLKALQKQYFQAYFALGILVGFAVFIGAMMLIVPGVIVACRLAFAEFNLLLGKDKILEAMSHSWDATRDYMWLIFAGYVLISIVLYLPYFYLLGTLAQYDSIYWLVDTFLSIVYSVLNVFYTIFAFRIFEFAKSNKTPADYL